MEPLPPALAALGTALILAAPAWRLLERARAAEGRAAEARLRLEAQGRSLSLVVRELETAGLALLGLATRLPAEPAPAPSLPEGVEAEGRRLLTLAEEVSDGLAQTGPRRLAENRIPLGPFLREALAAIALPMGEGARHWRVCPEAEALTLLADRRALHRALAQSLARAARETRPGDRIALRVVRAAETVALVIEDEGAGLPPGDLAVGARPADGTASGEDTRGLSIGLAAAREMMRAHGGELTLESTPGIGTRTWLTLPRRRVLEAA